MMFTNKEMIRDVVKDYAMENQKNDSKRNVVKCSDGCKFYMRFSKRIGNQFWQVVTLIEYHTCHRTADNRSAKTKWLANKFTSILRHSPSMKPSGLRAEAVERWGVKLSYDQAYREKRKVVKLVQGAGIEQFTHLRSYGQELLKSNPNSTVVIQCADSNDNHVFERIYVCLEACKAGDEGSHRQAKKQRNKMNDEPRNSHILPRRFSTVTCAKYGAMGHNKRSCKGKRAADRAIPKSGNKSKKTKKVKGGKGTKKSKGKKIEIAQSSQAPQPTQE
ncbi:hypothetical protein KIW84_021247 [Lathyrus oleraceus]|uniref:Uncharacterized protein n=1 Tax=Pisum sativum TaxID=3888 RepID=A0A9D4Y7Q0_PEA|nr:hypothetical protein KIW84_021247 [Pisum sativum]